jgi:selenocysteine lyase/cysteine desulfurase
VQHGAAAIVDGAHAIGNLGLDVEALGADAYVTNCHKWLCAPRGTALVWVSKAMQPAVAPLVASHGAGLGFQAEHLWAGTADLSAWLSVATAVEAAEKFGPGAARRKRVDILQDGTVTLLGALRCVIPLGCVASFAACTG